MRILIINTTRFGDTLQMQPLLRALKNDGHEIGLVCLENFVNVVVLLEGVTHAFPIPASYMLRFLKEDNSSKWLNSLVTIEDFIKTIVKEFNPERIINLTPLASARLLSRRISLESSKLAGKILPPVYGFTLDEKGYGMNTNAWATYMEAVTLNRVSSPINLADLFTLIAGASLLDKGAQNAQIMELSEEIKIKAKQLCHNLAVENTHLLKKSDVPLSNSPYISIQMQNTQGQENSEVMSNTYVALQLGASAEKRQWDMRHFVGLSHTLAEKGYTPIIVGAPNEEKLALEFINLGGIAKNAIGKTSIEELAGVLQECALLVTNDTGTMHLAAAVKIPILGIFMSTAQPWDTGAISLDACFVETRMPCHPCNFSDVCLNNNICRSSVSHEIIGEIVLKKLTSGDWGQHFSDTTRIWKSKREEDGFLMLEAIDVLDKNSRQAMYTMQRQVYKNLVERLQIALSGSKQKDKNISNLDNSHVPIDAKINRENLKELGLPHYEMDYVEFLKTGERQKLITSLSSLLELIFLLRQQGKLLGNVPKMSQMFLATNQKIITTFKELVYLVPLAYIWKFGMEKYGSNLDEFYSFTHIIQEVLDAWLQVLKD